MKQEIGYGTWKTITHTHTLYIVKRNAEMELEQTQKKSKKQTDRHKVERNEWKNINQKNVSTKW